MLRTFNIIIRCLNQLQENILNILTDIAGFCQRCCICDCKRNIDDTCQSLRQKRLTGTGRSEHQDITLLQFHAKISACQYSLIMIIYCYGKHLLSLFLDRKSVGRERVC